MALFKYNINNIRYNYFIIVSSSNIIIRLHMNVVLYHSALHSSADGCSTHFATRMRSTRRSWGMVQVTHLLHKTLGVPSE